MVMLFCVTTDYLLPKGEMSMTRHYGCTRGSSVKCRWFAPIVVVAACLSSSVAQQSTARLPVRDAQALAILGQAVRVAGGMESISALQSYSASGQITLYWTEAGTEGDVVMKGRGVSDFRLDAHMSNGVDEWWTVKDGSGFAKEADGRVHHLPYQELANIRSLCSPQTQLVRAIRDSSITVTFLGTKAREGRSSFGVRVHTATAPNGPGDIGGKLSEKDFYIDVQTFQIITVEDLSYPRERIADGIPHRITFSDYRNVDGIIFPFSIAEQVGKKRRLMGIHLNDMRINVPLTDNDFMP